MLSGRMQKLMQWLGNRFGAVLALVGPANKSDKEASEGGSSLVSNTNARVTSIGLFYTGVIGLIDLAAAKGMNFDFFYLLGCAFVGWAGGARSATVVTLIAGVFTYLDGVHFMAAALPPWVVYWNSVIRVLGFAAVGWLAAEVGRLTRSLERTVEERTSRLQSEVEEHKETSAR